jgi:hypothetical protein
LLHCEQFASREQMEKCDLKSEEYENKPGTPANKENDL